LGILYAGLLGDDAVECEIYRGCSIDRIRCSGDGEGKSRVVEAIPFEGDAYRRCYHMKEGIWLKDTHH
jgi:hypothetical protein